jgi:DNA topoisomerase VI subunit B
LKHSPSLGAERPVTKRPRLLVQPGKRLASPTAIQQAKKPTREPQFLQIVAKPEPKLTRVAFRVSRLMEFCSVRELQNQTGHSVYEWPTVICKELVDNALDACEEGEVAPEIAIAVEKDTIVVQDNAGGIDAETIESVLDYAVRVSSREAYVSPTRGAQGNALKTILAMGYVLDRGNGGDRAGVTVIEARGVEHRIEFRVDHVSNQPRIVHTTAPSPVAVGTRFTIHWPASSLLEYAESQVKRLVRAYVWFNPHASVRGTWFGQEFINEKATNPNWEKWRPRNPTSAHWYDEARLQRYLAAHVARDRDLGQRRTVREFIGEFRGLSSTAIQRKILTEVGCSHQPLASFFGADRVNGDGIARLLTAMRRLSKPVAPKHLGVIGAEHFKERFLAAGGAVDTFKYQCRKGVTDDIPYVIEFAFGLHQTGLAQGGDRAPRVFVTGANWSAAIENPFRRFGSTGEGLESTLAKVRANVNQPVICALHLASARLQFADRGKSSIILTDDAEQPDD